MASFQEEILGAVEERTNFPVEEGPLILKTDSDSILRITIEESGKYVELRKKDGGIILEGDAEIDEAAAKFFEYLRGFMIPLLKDSE